jgi:hypothetical protein
MKRLVTLAALSAALVLTAPIIGAPAPVANPETTYVVTRILPNQNEIILETFMHVDGDFESEQAIRQVTLEFADEERLNNPAWVIVIYGPTDGAAHTNDDRIWDSRVSF